MPLFFITKCFAPLILYALSLPMLSRSKSWGMFVYRVEKSKLSNCLALFVLLSFCKTSVALSMIQKQFTPVFLAIPSQSTSYWVFVHFREPIKCW